MAARRVVLDVKAQGSVSDASAITAAVAALQSACTSAGLLLYVGYLSTPAVVVDCNASGVIADEDVSGISDAVDDLVAAIEDAGLIARWGFQPRDPDNSPTHPPAEGGGAAGTGTPDTLAMWLDAMTLTDAPIARLAPSAGIRRLVLGEGDGPQQVRIYGGGTVDSILATGASEGEVAPLTMVAGDFAAGTVGPAIRLDGTSWQLRNVDGDIVVGLDDAGRAYTIGLTRLAGAVFAAATTDLGGNADLTFTSRFIGTQANALTVEYVDPETSNAALDVAIDYPTAGPGTITVSLATDGGGAITTTAQDIADAFLTADSGGHEAVHLVVTLPEGSDGSGLVAAGTWTLSSGADGVAAKGDPIQTLTIAGPGSGSYAGLRAVFHIMRSPDSDAWPIWVGLDDGCGLYQDTTVGEFIWRLGVGGGDYRNVLLMRPTLTLLQAPNAEVSLASTGQIDLSAPDGSIHLNTGVLIAASLPTSDPATTTGQFFTKDYADLTAGDKVLVVSAGAP